MVRRVDIAISVACILFGIFVVFHARTIESGLFLDPIGPRAFFYGCGVVFIVGGAVNLTQRYMTRAAFPGPMIPSEGVDDEDGHPSSFGRAALLALVSLLYIAAFRPLGYLIATPLYILAALWILKQRNWLLNITVAVVFTTVFYLTFAQVLRVWLPVGPFTDYFRDMGWIIL